MFFWIQILLLMITPRFRCRAFHFRQTKELKTRETEMDSFYTSLFVQTLIHPNHILYSVPNQMHAAKAMRPPTKRLC